jgi:hypothetical protein
MIVDAEYLEFVDVRELNTLLGLSSVGLIDGLSLAADIVNSSGGVLYKAGNAFGERQERKLRRLQDDFDQTYAIRLERNQALSDYIAGLIEVDLDRMEELLRGRKTFEDSLAGMGRLRDFFGDFLRQNPALALSIFVARECEREVGGEVLPPLYHHALFRTTMCVAALEFMQEYCEVELDPQTDYAAVVGASLVWYCAISDDFTSILQAERRRRRVMYRAAIVAMGQPLRRLDPDPKWNAVLDYVIAYYGGDLTVASLSSNTALQANAVIGIDQFVQMVGGYFGGHMPLKEVFDRILKMGIQGKLSRTVIEALAKGFPSLASFDFYSELDSILDECASRAGHPHPMRSLQSATLILCATRNSRCPHYGGEAGQPVFIAKDDDSGLAAGRYGACHLMTPRLKGLYDRYYSDIKAGVTSERNSGFLSEESG